MKKFTVGKSIAFFLGIALVVFLWDRIFPPNGSGANVLLGLFVVVIGVSMIAKHVGNFLDDTFFHGGSRERALLWRQGERLFEQSVQDFRRFKKKSRKNPKAQELAKKWEESLSKLKETLIAIGKEFKPGEALVKSQLAELQTRIHAVKNSAVDAIGKEHGGGIAAGTWSLAVVLLAALAFRAFIVEPFQIPSGSMIPTMLVGDHLFVSKLSYGLPNPFSSQPSYFVRWAEPKPGEVIVFQAPDYVGRNAGQAWIKRVIAGPGQRVKIRDSIVYVDDKPYEHVLPYKLITYKDFQDTAIENGFIVSQVLGKWTESEAIYTQEKIGDIEHDIYLSPEGQRYRYEVEWPIPGRQLPGMKCDDQECLVNDGFVLAMGDNRGNSADGRIWGALPIDNIKGRARFIWISVDSSTNLFKFGRISLPSFRLGRTFKAIH